MIRSCLFKHHVI